jgi:hypothetical protein
LRRLGQVRAIHFLELQLLGVGRDVAELGQQAGLGLELHQAELFQQAQATALVDRIAGDGHQRALGQVGGALVLLRVQADVGQDARLHRLQVELLGCVGVGQELLVLKVVEVDVAGVERDVGRGPVGELDDLHLQAFLLGLLGGDLHGVGEHAGHHADLQRARLGAEAGADEAEGQPQSAADAMQGVLHGAALLHFSFSQAST